MPRSSKAQPVMSSQHVSATWAPPGQTSFGSWHLCTAHDAESSNVRQHNQAQELRFDVQGGIREELGLNFQNPPQEHLPSKLPELPSMSMLDLEYKAQPWTQDWALAHFQENAYYRVKGLGVTA